MFQPGWTIIRIYTVKSRKKKLNEKYCIEAGSYQYSETDSKIYSWLYSDC